MDIDQTSAIEALAEEGQELITTAPTKKRKKKEAPAVFKVVAKFGETFLDFRKSNDDMVRAIVIDTLQQSMGYRQTDQLGMVYPLDTLSKFYSNIEAAFSEHSETAEDDGAKELLQYLTNFRSTRTSQVKANLDRGVIEFFDLPEVYKKGGRVIAEINGHLTGGLIESVSLERSWTGQEYYAFKLRVIHALNGQPEQGLISSAVGYFNGIREVAELPVRVPTDEEVAKLTARGAKFRSFTEKPTYLQYQGQLNRCSYFSDKNYRADGRVMIDSGSFSQIDSDQHRSQTYEAAISSATPSEKKLGVAVTISDDDLWRCSPFVYGFSFLAKQWGRFAVDGLSAIKWREDAFDKLVLDPRYKRLVHSLVQNHTGTFSDLIDGKGGGIIFLLHGPPGQGKTLTAEAVAELQKRPLYSISVGELGITPDELEAKLRVVLDVATVWNAVVLLDEADIFLEARDEHDIVRNAMVGIFLRLLEYHQGVLFLTTNRVKNIDHAFYSRISIAIRFTEADREKREAIWTNLLDSAGLEGKADPVKLGEHDLNGRQIKNIIRLSQTLSKTQDEQGTIELDEAFAEVVKLTTNFKISADD